jgi:hypothetical protein
VMIPTTCWGVRKSDAVPEHKNHERECTSYERRGDKESLKACTRLKSCESFYTLAPPFIGRRRDFLHPENTLKSREYF